MKIQIYSYSLYYSQNSYLGILYAYERLSKFPIEVLRRPIHIPRNRGVFMYEFLGGKDTLNNSGGYSREDCIRWASKHNVPFNYIDSNTLEKRVARWAKSDFEREELPSRVYYASIGTGLQEQLDKSLYRASFVHRQDVNELDVVKNCIKEIGLNPDEIIDLALSDNIKEKMVKALQDFENHKCPGIPTWVINGERFWGKDRVDMLVDRIKTYM